MQTLTKLARKVHCHPSTLRRLLIDKKIAGEKRPGKTGKTMWFVSTHADDVVALVRKEHPRSGWHKRPNSVMRPHGAKSGTFLASAVAWSQIPAAKRGALLKLSACTPQELALLLDLVKA